MSMCIQVKLPGSHTPETVEVNPDLSASENMHEIAKKLNIVNLLNVADLSLVVSPTAKRNGSIVAPNMKFSAIMFNPRDDVLELWRSPSLMNAGLYIKEFPNMPAVVREKKLIPVDFSSSLIHMIPVFERCFCLQPDMEFAFYYGDAVDDNSKLTKPRWLNCNLSLKEQDCTSEGILLCYPTAKLLKTPDNLLKADMKGWLYKRSMKKDHSSSKQRRLFILSDNMLYYFRKERDPAAAGVIPIEFYTVSTRLKRKKYQIFFNLASPPPFKGMTDGYKLQAETGELQEQWYNMCIKRCVNAGNKKVFGVDLKEVLSRKNSRSKFVPNVVRDTISYIDLHGTNVQGIFRISASATVVEYYKDLYDKGSDITFDSCDDPHIPSNLLKLYFRELPEPLFPYHLYEQFMSLTSTSAPDFERRLGDMLTMLPPENYAVAKVLFSFLYRVDQHHEVNKMGAENLATVFAPNLFRSKLETASIQDYGVINNVCKELIKRWESIFAIAENQMPALAQLAQNLSVRGRSSSNQVTERNTIAPHTNPSLLGELKDSMRQQHQTRNVGSAGPTITTTNPTPTARSASSSTNNAPAPPINQRKAPPVVPRSVPQGLSASTGAPEKPPLSPVVPHKKPNPPASGLRKASFADGTTIEDVWHALQEEIANRVHLEERLQQALARIEALENAR